MGYYDAPVYPGTPIYEPPFPPPMPAYGCPPAYPYAVAPPPGYGSDSGFGIALVVVVVILLFILGAVYYYPQTITR